jgi:hypothetical protein
MYQRFLVLLPVSSRALSEPYSARPRPINFVVLVYYFNDLALLKIG